MEKPLATFGIWEVTSDGINATSNEYDIGIRELFATRQEDGIKVWEFPIHLTQKAWLQGENAAHLQDFNQAFTFAQQHFAAQRPAATQDVDDGYTWKLQQQLFR